VSKTSPYLKAALAIEEHPAYHTLGCCYLIKSKLSYSLHPEYVGRFNHMFIPPAENYASAYYFDYTLSRCCSVRDPLACESRMIALHLMHWIYLDELKAKKKRGQSL